MNGMQVKVTRKINEAERIVSFELRREDGGVLPSFSAGSHIDVYIRPGLVRQYSLCNDPAECHRYLIAVLNDENSRGGSRAMHETVREGETIDISVPRNNFELKPASRYLLLAGGIGITPLLCMAEQLNGSEADFTLHYSARSIERAAFHERISASKFARQVQFHFGHGAGARRLDIEAALESEPGDSQIYVCGPAGFIETVRQAACARGWPESQIHREHFGATMQSPAGDSAFHVKLASSGKSYAVAPGQTIVQALQLHGIEIEVSCEQGICGTCTTRVLAGLPDHRDQYLTDEERAGNEVFTPCCSRSKTDVLVIDR